MRIQENNQRVRLLCSGAVCVLCALGVVLFRTLWNPAMVELGGLLLSTTDFFVLLAAGLCGTSFGLFTFTLLFAGELLGLLMNPQLPLFSLFIYLGLVLLAGFFSEKRWYASFPKTLLAGGVLTVFLASSWYLLARFLTVEGFGVYGVMHYGQMLLSAAPEVFLSQFLVYAFFRWASDPWKERLGQGFRYTKAWPPVDADRSVLGRRIAALVLAEGILLAGLAVFFYNVRLTAIAPELSARDRLLDSVQMALLLVTVTVPVAAVLNEIICRLLVRPVNRMSRTMENYFRGAPESREKGMEELKALHIRSEDEIGHLYRAMGHMVDDLSHHIETLQKEKELEEEVLRQTRRTAHLTRGFMEALASTVDAKDHYTSGHFFRVAQYSREIARRLGKTPEEQDEIYVMGLLHDIGKIGVPESIINKNGRLTDEEYAQIKQHPVTGYNILKNVEELPGLATGARWHHERYDGRGYPDGLAGEAIPQEARIIGVADAYDAMTSRRAYSDVRPQAQVREEILRCRGSQFDPALADILVTMIDEDKDYRMREFPPQS